MVNGRRLVGAIVAVTLAACVSRPNVTDLTSEPVVITRFDPSIQFGSFDTFAVNPSIAVLHDVGDAGTLPPDTTAAVVDRMTSNMSARGYRQVDFAERPSLGLQATVYMQINTATATATGTWWGVPGYAGPPGFWGFPGSSYFASWTYPTNLYKSATLIVELVDLRDGSPFASADASVGPPGVDAGDAGGGSLEVVWTAYGHGVADELLTSLEAAGLAAIDQAFLQSPYLQHRGTNE